MVKKIKKQKVKWERLGFRMPREEKIRLEVYAAINSKSVADLLRDGVKNITRPDVQA